MSLKKYYSCIGEVDLRLAELPACCVTSGPKESRTQDVPAVSLIAAGYSRVFSTRDMAFHREVNHVPARRTDRLYSSPTSQQTHLNHRYPPTNAIKGGVPTTVFAA
ncbi:hypothetical protein Bbelb_090910 [Branchiostoma belcheri]|nr:hypothetical protein Bbelb_090910 [Branchiostoma belcheri]